MAPKRTSRLVDPPAASSSEEEVESEEEEEPAAKGGAGNNGSDSGDFEKSRKKPKSSLRKKTVEKPSTTKSAPSKTSATGKRSVESKKAEKAKERDSKKKKIGDGEVEAEQTQDQKNPFRRVWSDDDELVLLNGMVDFIKKDMNPRSDVDEFLDAFKKLIHFNVDKNQLQNKMKRLKKKYMTNAKRGKDGEDPIFSNPHDIKCYRLMKEIWGEGKNKNGDEADDGNDDSATANVKRDDAVSPKQKTAAKSTSSTETSAPLKTTGKRQVESDKNNKEKDKDSKRKKKKKKRKKVGDGEDEDNSHPGKGEQKSFDDFLLQDHKNPFKRLWSDDDEIALLKGMRDFIKKGIDPTSDIDEFLESFKKSIHFDVNKKQLRNKIARLKTKYLNRVKKGKGGEDPSFKKPHDIKSYKLMKKIWGGKDGIGKRSC